MGLTQSTKAPKHLRILLPAKRLRCPVCMCMYTRAVFYTCACKSLRSLIHVHVYGPLNMCLYKRLRSLIHVYVYVSLLHVHVYRSWYNPYIPYVLNDSYILYVSQKVDIRLPGKENSNSHGARPVHQIISMVEWIRTSRLSTEKSLSLDEWWG